MSDVYIYVNIGAACLIASSQFKHILGLQIEARSFTGIIGEVTPHPK